MAIYRQGQASMDAQGYVTGYDTKWREQLTLIRPGATIFFLSEQLQAAVITEVINDTSIRAISTGGVEVPRTNYIILLHDSLTVDGLAQDVAETLRYYQGKEAVIEEAIEFFKTFKDWDRINEIMQQIKEYSDTAKNSAQSAEQSKNEATLQAQNSAQSASQANTAKDQANAANQAAQQAKTEAQNANTSAQGAKDNAAKSAADALNYRNQAQAIVGDNIGLGASPRDCPDISGNPSGYIGFMRIRENVPGWPSIASGEAFLTGFISVRDGTPTYSGVFVGWATRSLYTYGWSPQSGPQWARHARKDEVNRLVQRTGETRVCSQNANKFLTVYDSGSWGYYDSEASKWLPLPILAGGTGASDADTARKNLGVGSSNSPQFANVSLKRVTDVSTGWVAGGLLSSVLVGTSGSERVYGAVYPETNLSSPDQLTLHLRSGGVNKYASLNSNGEFIVDSLKPKSAEQSRRNMNIPTLGMGEVIEVSAPPGVEAGKYYPIIVNANYYQGYFTGFNMDVLTKSSTGGDPMNCCAFNGFFRMGGWSDRKDGGYGYFNRYQQNEVALHSICSSAKDKEDNLFVFVEGRAFPVKFRVPVGFTITVPKGEVIYNAGSANEIKVPWGVTDPLSSHKSLQVMFDFRLNRPGFYSALTEGLFYMCSGGRVGMFNGITIGEEVSMTMPKFTINGRIVSANAFFAGGDNTEKVSFISQLTVGDAKHQAEFRSGENCGQVVVRDFSSSGSHKFFNLNLDGTFSAPNGYVTNTGSDWNTQHTDNINKFRPIAGQVNSPENNVVYGGFHIGFSGSYGAQLGMRAGKAYFRTIEAGTIGAWNKIATESYVNSLTSGFVTRNDIESGNLSGNFYPLSGNEAFYLWRLGTTTAGANLYLNPDPAVSSVLRSTSSGRYKASVETVMDEYADLMLKMRPVWYRSTCENDREDWGWYGLIAEEVGEIAPEYVHWRPLQEGEDPAIASSNGMVAEGVMYERLTVPLIHHVKNLKTENEEMRKEIADLKNSIDELKAVVEALVNKPATLN